MKTFKAFIKTFEAPKEVWKQKFNLIFSLRPGLGWEGLKANSICVCHFLKKTFVVAASVRELSCHKINFFSIYWSKFFFFFNNFKFILTRICIHKHLFLRTSNSNNTNILSFSIKKISSSLVNIFQKVKTTNVNFVLEATFCRLSTKMCS